MKFKEHFKLEKIEINEASKEEIQKKIYELFKTSSIIKDTAVHNLANELKMSPHILEGMIYETLRSFLGEGRAKDFDGKFDAKELAMGIEVEYEHTTNKDLSERIAKDHLAELPDYYTRLAKMEAEGKAALKAKG